ncbi:MAG: amidase [Spirochaetaceae bacterium]|nr:MAG: amidase [Spirochaetaceae bacterium]
MSLVAAVGVSEALQRVRESADALHGEIERVLTRIAEVEPTVRAFIDEPERRQRLVSEAAALKAEHSGKPPLPPLYGLLVGVKDLFRVNGFETRAGSRLPAELFVGQQAGAVTRLLDAGALVVGKTVTTEFAYFTPGPTRNPWNPDHTPGGSSSGSAAAVAAGLCHAALGTQTIGSIIRPAAFCGIVGYKPSFGRISTAGVFPFSVSADHVGILTADVAGAVRLASVLCRPWSHKAVKSESGITSRGHTARRHLIGVPSERYLAQADATACRSFERALARLEASGFGVVRSELLDDIDQVNAAHNDMIAAEFAQVHAAFFDKHRKRYSDKSVELVLRGRDVDSERLARTRKGRSVLRERVTQESRRLGVTLWASPATASAAPRGIETTGSPVLNLPWTYAGLPTITLPCGFSDDHLPLGFQLTACYDNDELLLRHAAQFEPLVSPADG